MVTVVGLGFVGLTTALGFAEYGHKVYGIEVNDERMAAIRAGKLPFWEPGLDEALERHLGQNFLPTTDWETAVADSECVYYCVGTPYGEGGQADLTYLYGALEQTIDAIHDDKFRVLVTKSTIPPSTTEKRIIPFLEEHGVKIPEQLGVANNPEFLREGHCWEDFTHADRIVLGVTDGRSEAILRNLYAKEKAPVFSVSLNTGEFIKYLSNTSLACLISYANEMSIAADAIGGIDVANAFRILHMDKRWQTGSIRTYFYPGCGYGGYCLPKDTNAFYAVVKDSGFDGQILKHVIHLNDEMPEVTARRITQTVGENKRCCIGILGLSFNPGSDDVRDTPSAKIIRTLNKAGYRNIVVYDPVAMDEFQKYYKLDYNCADSYEQLLEQAETVAITTAWPQFGDVKTKTNSPVVDCRYML
ncbi:UDP-glucose 6-dehydrogenase [Firmicutes bacterium ASF500]|nr:UDP-glucose 6-dehydrogenase [Firmicutes bacterium ASF500]USF26372.1 UDP-glucose 6-dehydrogenase [Firmicutes bacterium ASF500]